MPYNGILRKFRHILFDITSITTTSIVISVPISNAYTSVDEAVQKWYGNKVRALLRIEIWEQHRDLDSLAPFSGRLTKLSPRFLSGKPAGFQGVRRISSVENLGFLPLSCPPGHGVRPLELIVLGSGSIMHAYFQVMLGARARADRDYVLEMPNPDLSSLLLHDHSRGADFCCKVNNYYVVVKQWV